MATATASPQHQSQLIQMAETWEMLAEQREREVARQARLDALSAAEEKLSDKPTEA